MKFFVTGATGFIGGRVARQLIAQGHYVNTVARNPAAARDLVEIGVKVYRGDITDKESMRGPMVEMDGVFHIAGWYKVGARDRQPAYPTNVLGTRNVLELMRELGVPRGVYTSTLAVFSDTHGAVPDESYRHNGPWLTTYDRTKWQAHYEVALPMIQRGLPLVIVQPGGVYGPGDTSLIRDMLASYLLRRLPIVPQRTAYCWGHVDDIAKAHLQAMDVGVPGQTYIIGGPVHTVTEVLALAERIAGIPAPRIQVPPEVMVAMAFGMAPLGALLPLPPLYTYEGLRSIAGVTYLGSDRKARRELGFDPRPLDDGLRDTLRALMRELGMRPRV
jgi:nucleoside-diphosphate-sugar epimerase